MATEKSSASEPHLDEDEAYEEQQRREALWSPQHAGGGASKTYRHIHIDWPNSSIKKTITIGASAPNASPPVYDRPEAEDEANFAASCVLSTKSSPINATVVILKEKKAPESASTPPVPSSTTSHLNKALTEKPILITAHTRSVGSITLTVPEYIGARPLHIWAKSASGNITIFLPTSFSGLLNWSSDTGTLKLSSTVQQRFQSLDSEPHKHKGLARIIPSTASGMRGDVLNLTSNHGTITIKEYGEASSKSDSKSCIIQ